jgi:hypothetical protein
LWSAQNTGNCVQQKEQCWTGLETIILPLLLKVFCFCFDWRVISTLMLLQSSLQVISIKNQS